MTTALLIFLLSLIGAFVLRVSGFGFGVFTMAWLPYLLPSYGEATTLSGLLAMSSSIFIVYQQRKYIVWNKLLPILITFVIVSFFSIRFVAFTDDGTLKKILGGTLILASLWFMVISKRVAIKPTIPLQILMGAISGLMGGLFAMQGPAAVLFFVACTKEKNEYSALIQSYLFIGNVMMLGFRTYNGFLTPSVGIAYCYGIIAVLLGTWIGSKVFNRLSTDVVKKIVYIYLAISGVISLIG